MYGGVFVRATLAQKRHHTYFAERRRRDLDDFWPDGEVRVYLGTHTQTWGIFPFTVQNASR